MTAAEAVSKEELRTELSKLNDAWQIVKESLRTEINRLRRLGLKTNPRYQDRALAMLDVLKLMESLEAIDDVSH